MTYKNESPSEFLKFETLLEIKQKIHTEKFRMRMGIFILFSILTVSLYFLNDSILNRPTMVISVMVFICCCTLIIILLDIILEYREFITQPPTTYLKSARDNELKELTRLIDTSAEVKDYIRHFVKNYDYIPAYAYKKVLLHHTSQLNESTLQKSSQYNIIKKRLLDDSLL